MLPDAIAARVAVEQAAAVGWERYVGRRGAVVGMHTFGASAPLKGLLTNFGFTPEHVVTSPRNKSPHHDLGDPALQLALGILSRGGSGSETTPRTFPTGGGLLMDETGVPGPTAPVIGPARPRTICAAPRIATMVHYSQLHNYDIRGRNV